MRKLHISILLVLFLIVLTSCTIPPNKDGIDGQDGINGVNGKGISTTKDSDDTTNYGGIIFKTYNIEDGKYLFTNYEDCRYDILLDFFNKGSSLLDDLIDLYSNNNLTDELKHYNMFEMIENKTKYTLLKTIIYDGTRNNR